MLYAACVWENTWLEAHRTGDTAAAATSAARLRQLAQRPDLAAVDNDGGVWAQQRRLAEAAWRGDANVVREAVTVECGAETR